MISLQRSMHSSQMYTPGPAISFFTCFWLFPQNEHFSRSPPSPMRATRSFPFAWVPPAFNGAWCFSHRRYLAVPPEWVPLGRTRSSGSRGTARVRHRLPGGSDVHRGLAGGDDLVDQTVGQRLLGGQDLVPLDVVPDLLD